MATPEGVARVKENKVATKQLKETFERMKELEARSKQHQVLEERLKRISLVLEKQKQEEEAQRILAMEIAQKNEEVLKQNQRIIEELAKLEHEEKVREEVLKARQVVRQQYAIEVEDLRYKGLSDIPKEQLLDMKESEEKVDLLKVPILSDIPQGSKHLRTPKGGTSQRQSFQKSSVSQKVTSALPQVSPQVSRSPVHTKQPQVLVSKGKSASISSSISGLGSKLHVASAEHKPSIALKKPKEPQQTCSSYKPAKVKENSSAYSSNGIPTKFSTQAKEKSPRLASREHASISARKKPSWNASTNHSSARKANEAAKESPTDDDHNTPKRTHLKSQQAQQSALSVLTKKVQNLKAEKRASRADGAAKSRTPTKQDIRPSSSRSQSRPDRSKELQALIPNIKKEFEPALARSRTPKSREEVKRKQEAPSERNSQDTDQTSCFGTLAPQTGPLGKQYYSRPGDHQGDYVRQEANYFTEPAGLSFQEGFSAGEPVARGSGEPPKPFIKPVPLLADSEVMIPATMARDVSESELQSTGTFLQAAQELKTANATGQSASGPQHIKLVWSSANSGGSVSKSPDMH